MTTITIPLTPELFEAAKEALVLEKTEHAPTSLRLIRSLDLIRSLARAIVSAVPAPETAPGVEPPAHRIEVCPGDRVVPSPRVDIRRRGVVSQWPSELLSSTVPAPSPAPASSGARGFCVGYTYSGMPVYSGKHPSSMESVFDEGFRACVPPGGGKTEYGGTRPDPEPVKAEGKARSLFDLPEPTPGTPRAPLSDLRKQILEGIYEKTCFTSGGIRLVPFYVVKGIIDREMLAWASRPPVPGRHIANPAEAASEKVALQKITIENLQSKVAELEVSLKKAEERYELSHGHYLSLPTDLREACERLDSLTTKFETLQAVHRTLRVKHHEVRKDRRRLRDFSTAEISDGK